MLPDIADAGRRVARTAIQSGLAVFTAFGALAAVYQTLVPIIGPLTRANFVPWLIAAALAVGSNAALYARIMAMPAVNATLGRLAGHTGTEQAPVAVLGAEPPTETTMMRAVNQYGGEFLGEPAH